MEQQLNNSRTDLLWELLANPADKDSTHTHNLQQLINDFPQSGILHALLAYAANGENVQQAAVYYDPKVLYRLSKDPETLPLVNNGQIIQPDNLISGAYFHSEEHEDELLLAPWADGYGIGAEEAEYNAHLASIAETGNTPEELPELVEDHGYKAEQQPVTEALQEDVNAPAAAEENIVEQLIPLGDESSIDDEVYDEIVGIDDINLARKNSEGADVHNEAAHSDESAQKDETVFNHRKVDLTDEAEKLILNNIAAADFFAFNDALGDKKKTNTDVTEDAPQHEAVEAQPVAEESPVNNLSKYNDEKMPYSFMWWLDKTRKEHAGIYQPFVEFKPSENVSASAPDELQQQYYENIFHLTSVEELERSTEKKPFEFGTRKKEDEIIDRFIQEVPQIKPQSGDKLDNENKAKKSSEDRDELVTETLAQIYTDQMLYPKAIAAYKKLMLKFPEKSRYFASQIQQLEKRTN